MNAPDTRTQVERRSQPVILDGLHAAQAQPGSITMVELAEHVAKALADAGLLADTRPAEPAQGDREALVDRRDVATWLIQEADQRVRFFPQRRDGIDAIMRRLAADLRTAPQPHADTVETVEWGVRFLSGRTAIHDEAFPRRRVDEFADLALICRTRVTTPDVVGPWEVVS